MKYVILAVTLALAACSTGAPVVSTSQAQGTVVPSSGAEVVSFQAAFNAARAANGASALSSDRRLTRAAAAYAQDMVSKGYFSHTGADGSTFVQRAEAVGYTCVRAENLANGQTTVSRVIESWMNSPAHRSNMLKTGVTEYGLGRVGNMWVLMIGEGC